MLNPDLAQWSSPSHLLVRDVQLTREDAVQLGRYPPAVRDVDGEERVYPEGDSSLGRWGPSLPLDRSEERRELSAVVRVTLSPAEAVSRFLYHNFAGVTYLLRTYRTR